jgi:hypothetical protein
MDRAPSSEPEETGGWGRDLAAAERRLKQLPEIELLGLLPRASNYTFLARLKAPGEDPLLAVYKPERGESPLWDFPEGTLYRREVAAYLLARELAWPRVPPTVARADAPHGLGALQLFVDGDRTRNYLRRPGRPVRTWAEVAAFDFVTNNADRKAGHCIVDEQGRTWVVDHGLTFHTEPKLRTVIWDFAGQPLPAVLREDLSRALEAAEQGTLRSLLGDLLAKRELAAFRRRLAAAISPGWCFPEPTSAWSVPWPPV